MTYTVHNIVTPTRHYKYLLDVPTCMNGGYRELYQQLQSPSGRARANGTRASTHVTFQRTTSERKLCFSAKLRRQRCCLAERCLQGILPACRPIHCPRPGAREQKKDESERAHQVAFLYETGRLPSSYIGNWCRRPRLCT